MSAATRTPLLGKSSIGARGCLQGGIGGCKTSNKMTIAMVDRKRNNYSTNLSPMNTQGVKTEESEPVHGIGIWVAALFLLGAIAGAGIMAMPNAFLKAGWWAIPMISIMSIIASFTGFQLSWCWTILQDNWPEYSEHTRNPYPEIAYRAGGNLFKYFAQGCVNLAMFGSAIAFIILSSSNISHLVDDWLGVKIGYCYTVLIVGGFLLPIWFFGTPKDFWPVAVGAICATVLAIIFIVIGTVIDMPTCKNKVTYPEMTVRGFISDYSTICFAYGGHAAFPTIQHDMKRPAKFPISVIISFVALFLIYLPMPALSYHVYGHTVQGTIDVNLSTKWIRDFIMVLITGHVLFAFFIVISPVVQDFERVINIPLHFSWKRVCTRATMMIAVLFVALTLPDFNALLELVGGTGLAATAYILPGPFYLMLKNRTHGKDAPEWKRQNSTSSSTGSSFFSHISSNGGDIPLWEYALNFVVVSCGLLGAVATVYSVLSSEANFARPCYLTKMHLDHRIVANNISHCWAGGQSFSNNGSF